MKREDQIKLIETVKDRFNDVADRVMSVPDIRDSVTRRADDAFSTHYQQTTQQVRYG